MFPYSNRCCNHFSVMEIMMLTQQCRPQYCDYNYPYYGGYPYYSYPNYNPYMYQLGRTGVY